MESPSTDSTVRNIRGWKALILASCIGLPAIAQAQEGDENGQVRSSTAATSSAPGEIVVTATRRDQRLQDVGIAIAAFSGDSLAERGVTDSSDIASLTPGVNLSGTYGGQSVQFSIRGVTQSDFNDAIEGPVAVYIDDIYIAS